MRVPKYIQDKMHRVAALERQATLVMGEIEGWLMSENVRRAREAIEKKEGLK